MEIALRPKENKSAMESGLELMRRMQGGLTWAPGLASLLSLMSPVQWLGLP